MAPRCFEDNSDFVVRGSTPVDETNADRPGRNGGSHNGEEGVDRANGNDHTPELSSKSLVVSL